MLFTVNNKEQAEMATAIYESLTESQKQEIRIYGCTEAEMKQAVESRSTFRIDGPAAMAASIISDCQCQLQDDQGGQFDIMLVEDVRQALNRAKWILFNYCK
jgi:hypothetical protein